MSDTTESSGDLRQIEPGQVLDFFSIEQLHAGRTSAEARLDAAKADIDAIDTEYARRFAEKLTQAMQTSSSRSTTLNLPTGFKVKGNVSKTVKWDSDKLQAIAGGMKWEQIRHFFKIKFSMSETVFAGLDPTSEFFNDVKTARTTKFGDLKITVEASPSEARQDAADWLRW